MSMSYFLCAGGGIEPPFAKTEPATNYREGGSVHLLGVISRHIFFLQHLVNVGGLI